MIKFLWVLLWVVAVISWWALQGCCHFLVSSGGLLLFPGGLWRVAVPDIMCTLEAHESRKQLNCITIHQALPTACHGLHFTGMATQ